MPIKMIVTNKPSANDLPKSCFIFYFASSQAVQSSSLAWVLNQY
jgi:hypothetical protein